MAQFHPLTVTEIRRTTRDAVVVTLSPQDARLFDFVQGQYLTFRRSFEGEELRRSYSICAGRGDGVLQVGIKRVDGGVFSTWANTDLTVGDVIEAMPPMGGFLGQTPPDAPHILAFAAGSGITPILSIIRTALATDSRARVTLVYSNRSPSTIMFREELEDLKNTHMGRLAVIHILSDNNPDMDLFQGRLDRTKCAALFRQWITLGDVTTAYICGPQPMMETVADSLRDHGVPEGSIRFELFGTPRSGSRPAHRRPVLDRPRDDAGINGRVTLGGDSRSLVIPPGTSLLDAALAQHIDAPFACKAGVCSTCKAKILEGEVEMIANHALEDYEVEAGYVLTCQCFPASDGPIVWDYDQAGH